MRNEKCLAILLSPRWLVPVNWNLYCICINHHLCIYTGCNKERINCLCKHSVLICWVNYQLDLTLGNYPLHAYTFTGQCQFYSWSIPSASYLVVNHCKKSICQAFILHQQFVWYLWSLNRRTNQPQALMRIHNSWAVF